MDIIERGVTSSKFARAALLKASIKSGDALDRLYDILAELGYFIKRGELYIRTGKVPPDRGDPIVAAVVDEIIVPFLSGRQAEPRPEILHSFTYVFQDVRILMASEMLPWGGLTLVAGFLPCGFSSELSAQAGRDLVIADDFQDVLDLEGERIALLPTLDSPLSSFLAPASFIALEPTTDLRHISSKFGEFNTAIICHRSANFYALRRMASEVFYVYIKGIKGALAAMVNEALGLGRPPACEEAVKELNGRIFYEDANICIATNSR
ncbi:MAG: hypothetical protein TU35_002085 [Thermoproteus sp. AZ2]|uniref:Uncharacterized protein n=1 Tax=Thermoproteus sp. AZ2 TaxID=1609232 RepID=A0ACC6UZE7_9CREN|nr:MAG: hypothetical protein TU35_09580 [Thermoproteus sp. AZ2]